MNEWSKSQLLSASAEKDVANQKMRMTQGVVLAMTEAQRSASETLRKPDKIRADEVLKQVDRAQQTLERMQKEARTAEEQ
ncbi:hypothetical protein, partial [Acinetobacter baumannii]|uniref:hypothetical protein n=1 Tax=Acinetobacter baumannii TaxID=470 RepID=UPI0014880D41